MAGNRWTSFLKQWMKKHPGKSLRDSMKLASADYKKSAKPSAKVGKKAKKSGKGKKKKSKLTMR